MHVIVSTCVSAASVQRLLFLTLPHRLRRSQIFDVIHIQIYLKNFSLNKRERTISSVFSVRKRKFQGPKIT